MVRNITSTLSVLFLGVASTITVEAATMLKPAMRGCPSSGYSRLVNVSTASQLPSALSGAQPGDQIRLAAGTYASTSFSGKGTASAPITICGVRGTWPIIKGGTFKLSGVANVNVSGIIFEGGGDNNVVGLMNTSNVLFTYNEVRNGFWHAGIAVDTNSNLEISHNYIHHIGLTSIDHGIYYRHQSGSNVIANNIITDNHGRGISMHSNGGEPVENTTVVNNTIIRNGSTGILMALNAGRNNLIANNILADNGLLSNYKQIVIRDGACGSCGGGGNTVMNNIVWSPNASKTGIAIEVSGNTVSNNLTLDPQFVTNYSDLHLRSTSPAIGLANPTYATRVDFEDRLRDATPDAGAFEVGGAPTPTPTPTPTPEPMPIPTPTPTPTPTPEPTPSPSKVLRIPVTADAFVNSKYPTTNRGAKSFLKVDNSPQTDALLKFTVSGVSGAVVQSVKLRLVPNASSSSGGELRRVMSNDWTEMGVTWNNAPAAGSTVLARQGATTKGQAIELDVTAEVKADGTYSFKLSNSVADSVEYDFYSREGGASVQPELVITLAP